MRLLQLKLSHAVDECGRIGPSCMKMNGHIESTAFRSGRRTGEQVLR